VGELSVSVKVAGALVYFGTYVVLEEAVYDSMFAANAIGTDSNAIADAILKRDWTVISGEALYSLLNAARMLRNVWSTAGGTLTVKKEDGTTTAWTRTLTTDPSAEPITGAT
jgi:hypothetical protein